MKKIISIHGINTSDDTFDDALQKALEGVPNIAFESVYWGAEIHEKVQEWANKLPESSSWNPIIARRLRIVREAHRLARWVRLYSVPKYQGAIVTAVEGVLLSALENNGKVIIISHSLGTVVLVDTLIRMHESGILPKEKIPHIITMGSPLGFWQPNGQLNILLSHLKTRWVNFFDKDDLVSGDYGLRFLEPRIKDFPLNSGWVLRAHSSLWAHRKVRKYLLDIVVDS